MKKEPNGRYKEVIKNFPANVPQRLIKKYNVVVREFEESGGYQRKLARALVINDFYVNQLLLKGIEPTDKTEHGQELRVKLFLPRKKPKPHKQKILLPGERKVKRKIAGMAKETRKEMKEHGIQ